MSLTARKALPVPATSLRHKPDHFTAVVAAEESAEVSSPPACWSEAGPPGLRAMGSLPGQLASGQETEGESGLSPGPRPQGAASRGGIPAMRRDGPAGAGTQTARIGGRPRRTTRGRGR
jgi:hypothetical protein